MRKIWSPVFALLACSPIACGDDPNEDSGSSSPDTSGTPTVMSTGSPAEMTGTTTSPGAEATGTTAGPPPGTDTGSADDTMPSIPPVDFDLGAIPDAPPFDTSCGEVDFLFVIDNSGSMGDEQAALVNNFPGFITGIQQTLEGVDSYHVGVVTTDEYDHNPADCQSLSSVVVQTGGPNSSMAVCGPFMAGANYMTEDDDLASGFNCAAQVGTDGSGNERAMQAVVEAATSVDGAPGQCNDGFMREEALLVIVIITDESDSGSLGNAQSWFDDVVATKGGNPEKIVVLSIINTPMGACGPDFAFEISAFTAMFGDQGFEVDICQGDYEPFFQDAISVIDIACETFPQD